MKINYTMMGCNLTGGVRVLFEIANGLADRGHDVTITTIGPRNSHKWFPLKARVNYVGSPLPVPVKFAINYGLEHWLNIRKSPFQEIRDLTNGILDCDINVATFCLTTYSVLASGKGIPFYHMQHYESLLYDDKNMKVYAEATYYLPLQKIANSIWLRNQMKEHYNYDLPIVNPAIDHATFYPRNVERNWNKLRVVCFGKSANWKGFKDALAAMKIVMKKKDNVEFIVYGQRNPALMSDVPFKMMTNPSDEELATLYSSADVVICPSWYESFPLPALESMACGAPVVTTRYGTEDYAVDGQNSLVTPPRSPEVFAEAILRLLDDEQLREQFRKEGPRMAKQFTYSKTVDQVEDLFKKALKSA